MIVARRLATARAMLGTLLLSTGTPMLLAGDELWRTQRGNNNAYCLDDPTSWADWSAGPEAASLTAFTALVSGDPAQLRPPCTATASTATARCSGGTPTGRRLRGHDWHDGGLHSLGLQREEWLLLLHAGAEAVAGDAAARARPFIPVVDSTRPDGRPPTDRALPGGTTITLPPRSLLLLRQRRGDDAAGE